MQTPESDHEYPANALAGQTSPYLLSHAHNPVRWHPWGPEALELAKAEDKPIFLSVGYSACHWCHVMERETFEDPKVGAFLAEHFVSIKVDREERPDIDEVYMAAVQAMTGSGGWPMTVFLTPELEPFYGGTYFPPAGRQGMPSFMQVVSAISERWREDPQALVEQGTKLTEHLAEQNGANLTGELDKDILERNFKQLHERYDPEWGGFGAAPKFPHSMDIRACLRHAKRTGDSLALEMAVQTLDKMAAGGIHDQLGGGFHRYSVDEKWLIPHFEKMLYDNGLLVPAYLDAFQLTGEQRHAEVARRALDWMLREMLTSEGGFSSAQDADSAGVEGAFFAWTPEELVEVLGPENGRFAAEWFGVTPEGNFEHGTSALWRPEPGEVVAQRLGVKLERLEAAIAESLPKLLAVREQREKPATDDKVLTSWNGMAIGAAARASRVLGEPRYLAAAQGAATFIWDHMRQESGRLFATSRAGRAQHEGTLDDYAFFTEGLIELYQADGDPRWIERALTLAKLVEEHFSAGELGGYFNTADCAEALIVRPRTLHDGALPAGNAIQAGNLLRLAALTGQQDLADQARGVIASLAELANRHPSVFSQLLHALELDAHGLREVVLAGPREEAFEAQLNTRFLPDVVVARASGGAESELLPLLEGRGQADAAFVCSAGACQLPAESPAELGRQLDAGAR